MDAWIQDRPRLQAVAKQQIHLSSLGHRCVSSYRQVLDNSSPVQTLRAPAHSGLLSLEKREYLLWASSEK